MFERYVIATLAAAAVLTGGSAAQAQGFAPHCLQNLTEICGRVAVSTCFQDENLWSGVRTDCLGDIQTMIEMDREAREEQAQMAPEPEYDDPAGLPLDILGYSYGGILRAGPGMDYPKIASLQDGDQIHLVENTMIEFDNYAWFKVESPAGVGYHWGGILCTEGAWPIGGAFAGCSASEVPLAVFSCRIGSKTVSVHAEGAQLTYRYGTQTNVEKSITGDAGSGTVRFLQQRFAGMVNQLRFSSGAYSYIVYSAEGNGNVGARATSGLVVMQGLTVIADKTCATQAEFSPAFDYRTLPEDSAAYSAM